MGCVERERCIEMIDRNIDMKKLTETEIDR